MERIHPSAKLLRHLRETICTQCVFRPEGSDTLPGTVARSCEPGCQVFAYLPNLLRVALTVKSSSIAPYERACEDTICSKCESSPTHGDYCSERKTERCPLALYLGDAIGVIEGMRRQELIAA